MRLISIGLILTFFALVQSGRPQTSGQPGGRAEGCHAGPSKLKGGAIHILRVEVLFSRPTDGTYADEGYGQGEFDTVRLLEVVKSTINWKLGLVFRVHPFSGELSGERDFAPEHLIVGKRYYLVYTYHLDEEPQGNSDLIGLTRCGVYEDTKTARRLLLSDLGH